MINIHQLLAEKLASFVYQIMKVLLEIMRYVCLYINLILMYVRSCQISYFFFNSDVVTTKKSTQKPTEIKTTITTEAPNVEGKHRLSFVLIQI